MRKVNILISINSFVPGAAAFIFRRGTTPASTPNRFLRDHLPVSDASDCNSPETPENDSVQDLPTRQKNALRILLSKPQITPQEIANLDYNILLRAPGVGKKSIEIIRIWLNSHGHVLKNYPHEETDLPVRQRKGKLDRAIDYLRWHGYEVHRSR